ncbi:Putative accessory gland protein [Gryllus bimaculatus]|nr:Putative accessory gland protein [Gryllus bimaculatus]
MLLRVIALAVCAAVAMVDVCAAPSDGEATADAASPVAPWVVLLKPDGEDGDPLLRENAGATDPGPGQSYKKKIMEETLKSIANSLVAIPPIPAFPVEDTARTTGTRNVALASEVHNTVQNNQPITNTFNIVESPVATHAPHHPLVKPVTLSNSNSLKASDDRFYRPRRPYRIAPAYDGCNGLTSCVNSYSSKIVENTMDSIANSIMFFPNLIAGSGLGTYSGYDTRGYDYRPHPYTTYVPKTVPTNNVAMASEVYNTFQNSIVFHSNELTSCIDKYEKKILKNSLKSVVNSMTSISPWTATDTGEAYGNENVANAVAVDNGAYDTDVVAGNSVAPVIEVVSPSYASEGLHKLNKRKPQITQSFNDGLSSFIDNLESSIVKQTMTSIANSMAFPTWFGGNAATQSAYGTTGENIANAVAIDKEVTRPVIKTVRPSYILKKHKISSLQESNIGSQVTDGLSNYDVIGSGNVANAVAVDDTFNGNLIVNSDDSKSSTIDSTQWGVNEGAAYSGNSIANAVAIDKDGVSAHPVINIARPSYLSNKNKLETDSGLKVTGGNSDFGVVGFENVANAVAIDDDYKGNAMVGFDESKSTIIDDTQWDVNEGAVYGGDSIANAVAIDKDIDVGPLPVIKIVRPSYVTKEHELSSIKGSNDGLKITEGYSNYGVVGSENVANAVAIDEDVFRDKITFDTHDSESNVFKESDGEADEGLSYSSYSSGNIANAVAVDGLQDADTDKEVVKFQETKHDNFATYPTYHTGNIANAVAIDDATYDDEVAVFYDDSKFTNTLKEVDEVHNTGTKEYASFTPTNVANAVAIDGGSPDDRPVVVFDGSRPTNSYKTTSDVENTGPTVYSTYGPWNIANAVAIDEGAFHDKTPVTFNNVVPMNSIKETHSNVNTYDKDFLTYNTANIANKVPIVENQNVLQLDGNDNKGYFDYFDTNDEEIRDTPVYPTYNFGNVANAVAIDGDVREVEGGIVDSKKIKPTNYVVGNVANAVAIDRPQTDNWNTNSLKEKNEVDVSNDAIYSPYGTGSVANAVAIDDDLYNEKVDGSEMTYALDTYDDTDYDTIDIEPSVDTVADEDENYEDESVFDEKNDEVEVNVNENYSAHTSGNVANAVAIDVGGFKPSGSYVENTVPLHTTFVSAKEPVKPQNFYKISGAGSVANAVAVDTDEGKVHVGDSSPVSPSKIEEER